MTLHYDPAELVTLVPELNPRLDENLVSEWNRGRMRRRSGEELERYLAKRVGPWLPTEWTRKGGHVVPIQAMDNDHLRNTIRFLVRAAAITRAQTNGHLSGLMSSETWGPRGDGAQMACESVMSDMDIESWADHAKPVLWAMLAEARRRGTVADVAPKDLAAYGQDADLRATKIELAEFAKVLDADKLSQIRRIV